MTLAGRQKNNSVRSSKLVCRLLHHPDFVATGLALSLLLSAMPSVASSLLQIKKRGELIVGVKTDYPPFGQHLPDGQMQGLEHDLAADLASRMKVKLKRVSVTGANRLQKLEDGTVDILIATLGDTEERRRVSTLVEPGYYESGATLLVPAQSTISNWQDLRGQIICISQGGYFNGPMAQTYLFVPLTFNTPSEAKLALHDGRCNGYLYDNIAAWADLQKPEWSGYKVPIPADRTVAWAIALPRTARGSPLELMISDTLADWHRTGYLIDLEKKWHLPTSAYLAQMHSRWSEKSATSGSYFCSRNSQGFWPAECKSNLFVAQVQAVSAFHQSGLDFKNFSGLDLSFIYNDYDRKRFLSGLKVSILIMLTASVGSLLLGLGGAFVMESGRKFLTHVVRILSTYAGMTPPLLQIYLLLLGVGSIAKDLLGWQLPAWLVVFFCLSLYAGSSVMRALLESCEHLRKSNASFRLRIKSIASIAQAYEGAAGSISASLVNISKASMIASVIAVPELLSATTSIMLDRGNVSEMMNALLITFMLLIGVSIRLIKKLEEKLRKKAAQTYA